MEIVFFTNKSAHGICLLNNLKKTNIKIKAIIIDEDTARLNKKQLVAHHIRNLIPIWLLNTTRRLRGLPTPKKLPNRKFYSNYSKKIISVDSLNSKKCEFLLNSLKPDLIILGGARILKKNIISLPRIGILNAHPGLLPKYRGVDVIRWAILNHDPLGVTVHFVNAGVDTGKIITRKEFEIEPEDTIDSLKQKAIDLAGELISSVVLELSKNENIISTSNPITNGKQYYTMQPEKIKKVDQILLEYGKKKNN
jgi:methionyl-tRNA formyltransferase